MILGLTGTYCAGKNYVAAILEKRGYPVLDVDKLGHQVIETEKTLILERFGRDILRTDGTIDRKRLGAMVFGKNEEMAALEGIIHPAVNRETSTWIETVLKDQEQSQKIKLCVINAALLHRSSAFEILDALIIVEAPFIVRLLRAKRRDHLSWNALIKRFQSQKEFSSHYLSKQADIYRVKNSGFADLRFLRFLGSAFVSNFLKNPIDQVDEILSSLACNKA